MAKAEEIEAISEERGLKAAKNIRRISGVKQNTMKSDDEKAIINENIHRKS